MNPSKNYKLSYMNSSKNYMLSYMKRGSCSSACRFRRVHVAQLVVLEGFM
jgi:hypothetical protein